MIEFEPRKPRGILWIASYPRSGNTWMRVFLYCLRKIMAGERPDGIRLDDVRSFERSDVNLRRYERLAGHKLDPQSLEIAHLRPAVQMEIARTTDGIAIVKTHNAHLSEGGHPMINPQATAGAIYVVRNPLDVAVSLAAFSCEPINQTIDRMGREAGGWGANSAHWASGSWSQNVESWTKPAQTTVRVVRYEDMVSKASETFASVARHLRLALSEADLGRAIEAASFHVLQAAERQQGFVERPKDAPAFFREGRIGQWRERLDDSQVAKLIACHGRTMARFGYLPDAESALVESGNAAAAPWLPYSRGPLPAERVDRGRQGRPGP